MKSHHIVQKNFFSVNIRFSDWHQRSLKLIKKILVFGSSLWNYFSPPITILYKKFYLLKQNNKDSHVISFYFVLFRKYKTLQLSFWIFPSFCRQTEMICWVIPNIAASYTWVYCEFLSSIKLYRVYSITSINFLIYLTHI